MSDSPSPTAARGSRLLLQHCDALTDDAAREPGLVRLEQLVGDELARMLVAALAGPGRERLAA
jgi:hypothetical protein